jgi:hypothetical protein
MKILISLVMLITFGQNLNGQTNQNSCLFKNPMCFYTSDILTYLQALHKNMLYEEMLPFLYGPKIKGKTKQQMVSELAEAPFGYQLKRVGIRIIQPNKSWTLRFERTLLGTKETFDIQADLENGVCKLYLDEKSWNTIFRSY